MDCFHGLSAVGVLIHCTPPSLAQHTQYTTATFEKVIICCRMEEEALALMVQNLRIKLSKAEAQLAALKEAQATKQNAKAEGRVDDTLISTGDRVTITWDRHWRYGTSKKGMPKTDMEGATGTVETVSACYVWVRVDGTNDLYKKRKHNVTRLGRI